MTLLQQLEAGVAHHQAGRFGQAESIYRQILTEHPDNADALHLLGVLVYQAGRVELGRDLISRAIARDPTEPAYHRNLGLALLSLQKTDDAIAAFRRAIELKPDFAYAHASLGQAFMQEGSHDHAVQALARAVFLQPDAADILRSYCDALHRAGQIDQAITEYQRLLVSSPNDAIAWNNLGSAHHTLHQYPEAQSAWRQALALQPDFPEALCNLGDALCTENEFHESITLLRKALALRPDYASAANNCANALCGIEYFDEAIEQFQKAVALNPSYFQAWGNLAQTLACVGLFEESLQAFDRALQINPASHAVHHNRLYSMLFHPGLSAETILQAHQSWNHYHARPLRQPWQYSNDRSPHRPLKIGYVSADFTAHVIGRNLLPLLREHDRAQFDIFCYSTGRRSDSFTVRFQAETDHWRDLDSDDAHAADTIRNDAIDILIDTTLHMNGNRLLMFARKPAPIQITFIGYPGTTGLDTIDYRITDPHLDPPNETDSHFTEKSIRLPHSFWCYDPLSMEVSEGFPVSPLPALTNGHITFGCLNNFRKLNNDVLKLWAKVLSNIPDSRLVLVAPPGQPRQRVLAQLQIDPTRIEFVNRQERQAYLKTYNRIDVSLDTFPYNGHTTTLDSLWMGVPVVSLLGQTVVGRAGHSQLTNIDLRELAAKTPEEFIEIATKLANDKPRLLKLRQSLRERMRQSPLTDARRFARNIESIYRDLWRQYCKTP